MKIKDRKAIIYGRFQPLTKAHYNMIKKAINDYQEVFVFPVQGVKAFKSDKKTKSGVESELKSKIERNPFPVYLRYEMLSRSFPQLDDKHIIKSERGDISHVISLLRRNFPTKTFDKIDVFAGEDEYDDYVRQKKYVEDVDVRVIKYEEGTRFRDESGDIVSSVSATKLREYILLPDKEEAYKKYKSLIAPPLADMDTFLKIRRVMKKMQKKDIKESLKLMSFEVLFEKIADELKKQGLSVNKPDSNYNEIELEIGELVELEHVNDIKAAREIAKDHLEENPFYYTKVLSPKEEEVKKIAIKVLNSHNFKSIKDYLDKFTTNKG